METEGPFIKVPIECVSQVFRKTRKTVTQELTAVLREINNLASAAGGSPTAPEKADADGISVEVDASDASAKLGELLDRLAKLKALAQEASREEKRHISGLRKRLELLAQSPAPVPASSLTTMAVGPGVNGQARSETPGERTRLDRCIVEYLLRRGHSEAARALSEEAGIEDYVTIELFERAKEVEAAIRAKDLGPALRWCDDNASRLRKLESKLEFRIRERAFLEMVRGNKREEAIQYARDHLSPHAASHGVEIQRAMATLAFPDPAAAPVPEYAALFADGRWEELASEFLEEMQGVFGLTQPSMLELVLQGGLSALKTPLCSEDKNHRAHCPTCSEEGRALGKGLPCAHHGQSFLICRQSGDPIGEDNPPLALPNGRVFGSRALQAMARPSPGVGVGMAVGVGLGMSGPHGVLGSSLVSCPATGEKYRFDQLRNVFII